MLCRCLVRSDEIGGMCGNRVSHRGLGGPGGTIGVPEFCEYAMQYGDSCMDIATTQAIETKATPSSKPAFRAAARTAARPADRATAPT